MIIFKSLGLCSTVVFGWSIVDTIKGGSPLVLILCFVLTLLSWGCIVLEHKTEELRRQLADCPFYRINIDDFIVCIRCGGMGHELRHGDAITCPNCNGVGVIDKRTLCPASKIAAKAYLNAMELPPANAGNAWLP